MHICVRHDTIYDFSSGLINVGYKEKKPLFVAHFHEVFGSRPLTPYDFRPKFCAKWKTWYIYVTLKDNSFGSNFRVASAAITLNLFWLVFDGIHPPNVVQKTFTSDAIKLSQKKNFWLYELFGLHSHEDA